MGGCLPCVWSLIPPGSHQLRRRQQSEYRSHFGELYHGRHRSIAEGDDGPQRRRDADEDDSAYGRSSRRSRRDDDLEDFDTDIQLGGERRPRFQRQTTYYGGDGLFPFYLAVNSDGEDELFPWQPAVSSDGYHPLIHWRAYAARYEGEDVEHPPWQPEPSPDGEQPVFFREGRRLLLQDISGDLDLDPSFSWDGLREIGSLFVPGYGIFPPGVIPPGLTGSALREFLDERRKHEDLTQKILSTAFSLPDEALLKMYADSCIICFGDFEVGSNLLRTPCDHHFCASCLCDWMAYQMRCPVCRTSLDCPLEKWAHAKDMAFAEVKAANESRERVQVGTARESLKERSAVARAPRVAPRRDYEKPWLVRPRARPAAVPEPRRVPTGNARRQGEARARGSRQGSVML